MQTIRGKSESKQIPLTSIKMTIFKELKSWSSPSYIEPATAPRVGDEAPSDPNLALPADNGKPTIIAFLRHCGCPGK
jgi:hypothetical protein